MNGPTSRQLLLSRDDAVSDIKRILKRKKRGLNCYHFNSTSTPNCALQITTVITLCAMRILCVLLVGLFADMSVMVAALWKKDCNVSKHDKEAQRDSIDTLEHIEMVPVFFAFRGDLR